MFSYVVICDENLKCQTSVETGYYSVLVDKNEHQLKSLNCSMEKKFDFELSDIEKDDQ